jgi:integrase
MRRDDIARFLGTLDIGCKSRYSYVTPLRAFRALALEREDLGEPLSIETVRCWLKRDAARSPLANVVERMGIISRYLDWRASRGSVPNPLAALLGQYGRRLTPIVRALLREDYPRALDELRPLPEWGSILAPVMHEHVKRMRSLGYRYQVRGRDLQRFDRFLQQRKDLAAQPLLTLLAAWCSSCRGIRHQLRVQQCGRTITQAMHRKDMATPILSIDLGLQRRVLQEERKPYIYSESDIMRLYEAARTFPSKNAPLRPIMLRTMLTLAYCAGLRMGEIAALTLTDVDTRLGIIEIRETKFCKSRRLPLAPSMTRVLAVYMSARQAARAPIEAGAPMWWSPLRRKAYSYGEINKLMIRLIRRASLKPAYGQSGPRAHDLRHTFVAHRMLQWYREGVDPQARLPHLATYLGHKDIVSTLVYLNITPELLREASERHRRRGVDALGAEVRS